MSNNECLKHFKDKVEAINEYGGEAGNFPKKKQYPHIKQINVDVVQDCQKEVEIKEVKHHYFEYLFIIRANNSQYNDLKTRFDNDQLMGKYS